MAMPAPVFKCRICKYELKDFDSYDICNLCMDDLAEVGDATRRLIDVLLVRIKDLEEAKT